MTKDRITFKCARCGSTLFDQPDNPGPNDSVTCNGCGAIGRYGDIQAAAIKLAKKAAEDALSKALEKSFRGKKGITFRKR